MHKFLSNHFFLILLLILFFILSFMSSFKESLTFDEIVDLQEGRNAILYHSFNIDPYNPPLTREIAVMPYIFSKEFYAGEQFMLQKSLYGRLPIIFLGIFLIIFVYFFTQKYIGRKEAIFASFLVSLEPNILANSHYITMDIGLTLIFFLSIILFVQVLEKKTIKTLLLLILAIGFGMTIKISFIPYFFLSALFIILLRYKSKVFSIFQQNVKVLFVSAIAISFVIWSVYLFNWNVVIKPRQDGSRVSSQLQAFSKKHNILILRNSIIFFEQQRIPLGDYLATLKNNALRGLHTNTCFFLGNYYSACQWYFMPINLFLKLPIPLMILFMVSLILFLKKKKKNAVTLFLLTPTTVILLTSMILRLNPLVRYILPVIPFVIVFSVIALPFWTKTFTRKVIFCFLILWYLVEIASSFPHFISYANELTLDQKQFLLTDSNMDWGQSLPDVKKYALNNSSFLFSYFGRDNGNLYNLKSNTVYGSYKKNEICAFHQIGKVKVEEPILISVSNWYACGYNRMPEYAKSKIKDIIAGTTFIF